jgi:hypothetical protein
VRLRSELSLLVFGALVPVVVFTVFAARLLVAHERETMERDAIGRARAAMSSVDAHLRGSIASLETLAASRNLASGDIAAFHSRAQRVLRIQPAWVNISLSTAAKVRLSNAVYNFGKPEPFTTDDKSFDAVVRSARPGISNVLADDVVRSPTVQVRVPVSYGGEVRYVISAAQNLKHLAGLLEAQRLPEGWVINLADRDKRVIVRIPPVPAGLPVADSLREAIERAPEGWFQGATMEGRSAYTSYVTSPLSGWVLGIAIPAGTVEAGERRLFAIISAIVLLAFASGALLAWLIARRLPK